MVNYTRTNTIIGWLVFGFALLVYYLTLEPSVSFWDCGEFIASSYRLQVVHPPGAPLFQMLGRLFSLLSFGNVEMVAFWVNMLSAVASAFCVMLTYFITSRLAQKLINPVGLPLVKNQAIMVWGTGVVGALTLTFTDTFWFSAVEAEVYALSSFFTMLVFWAALKWDEATTAKPRWLVFIAFTVGLSIGVHLLNLLVVPAVILVLYFSKRGYSLWRLVSGAVLGLIILLFVQFGIIPGLPQLAANTDKWLVNGFGWSIGSGIAAFFSLLSAALLLLLIISRKKNLLRLHTGLLCLVFLLVGYSSYIMVPIRAAAHPPININAPEDAFSFLSYLNRDQYGKRSLIYGPSFNAPIKEFKIGEPVWRPLDGKYVVTARGNKYTYDPAYMTYFPRMGSMFSTSSQTGYVGWTSVDPSKPPPFTKNIEFFFKYQVLHMYVRYHLWNFAGRQNNKQGHGNAASGNGVSGIGFIDKNIAAPEELLPDIFANNKGRNFYYFLPLLLGLAGLFFHASRKNYGFFPLFLLFLFTGFFLCIYLNIPPFEPRERDYVYVGSFQVFSIWVGMGALWLMRSLHRLIKQGIWIGLIVSFFVSPFLLASQNWDDHDRSHRQLPRNYARNCLLGLAPNAVLFVYGDNDTYPLWYLQSVEGVRPDVRIINANLLNTDWAAYELEQKKLDADPLKLTISPDKYLFDKRELVRVSDADSAVSLGDALQYVADDSSGKNLFEYSSGRIRVKLPAKKLFFTVDADKTTGWVAPGDSAYAVSRFDVPISSASMFRAELMMLDVIANNFYQRPIYFASFSEAENLPQLNKYLRLEGLAYRLVPMQYPDTSYFNRLNTTQMATTLQGFDLSGYNNPKTLVDPDALTIAYHYRNLFSLTAEKLLAEGNPKKAAQLTLTCIDALPVKNIDYKYPAPALVFLKVLYKAGNTVEADAFYKDFSGQLMQKVVYYRSIIGTIADFEGRHEGEKCLTALTQLKDLLISLDQKEKANELTTFLALYPINSGKTTP